MPSSRTPQYLAKILNAILARDPGEFALVPDAEGWVKIKDLLKALHEEGFGYVNRSHLQEVILSVPDPPIEICENRIRATDRSRLTSPEPADTPPGQLFAAVRRRAHPVVLERGLQPAPGNRVLLAAERDAAVRIGRRIDPQPVILTVQVEACRRQGILFDCAGPGLFLADGIPPGCFTAPPLPKERLKPTREETPPEPEPAAPSHAGSFTLDPEDILQAPGGYIRRTAKGKKLDPKRFKKEKWSRERPPWRQ
jgi:putative RNA 2'-phosphotransferase